MLRVRGLRAPAFPRHQLTVCPAEREEGIAPHRDAGGGQRVVELPGAESGLLGAVDRHCCQH